MNLRSTALLRRAALGLALSLSLQPGGSPVRAAPSDAPVAPPPMQGEPMAFVGIGGVQSCTDFARAAAAERQSRPGGDGNGNSFRTTLFGALMAWADGYVTAKNEDELIHRIAGSSTTLEQRARWLDLFCQAHPEAPFFAAVFRLREHLVADGL